MVDLARLSEQEIAQIRNRADIVDVIGRYIPLHRKGKSYTCTCPFHDDHSPSLSISQDKQIYKCFVCNAGGNVFGFVQNYEKISYIEAVYKVAGYANVPIEHSLVLPQKKIDPRMERLHKACHETIEYTHYQLNTLDAKHIKEYLYKRNITDEIIKMFEIGYNPSDDALYRFLHAKKMQDEDIIDAGVVRLTSIGIKDVFSNRIMIPIHDINGEPVGFTARRVKDSDEAKYINTSETDIYKKGDLIFNYHRAKRIARQLKKVVLVEGAMDVIAFEKVDIHHCVATLGTAVTNEQLKLLKLLQVPIVVCYDGDTAGKNATYKFGKLARKMQLPFEIIDNRLGLDPDEIIDAYGKERLLQLSEKTISWIDFLFSYLLSHYNLNNYSQKKEFAVEMAEEIGGLSDQFEKQSYYIRLKELTEFDMQPQETQTNRKEHVYQASPSHQFLPLPKSGRHRAEHEVLSQMLCGIAASNYYKEELGFMKDDICNKLAIYIIDYYRNHSDMNIADLLDYIHEEQVRSLLLEISDWDLGKDEIQMMVLEDAVDRLKLSVLDDKIQYLNEKIKHLQDPMEKATIAREKNELIKQRGEWLCQGRN